MTTLSIDQIHDAIVVGTFAFMAALEHYGTNGQRMEMGFRYLLLFNDDVVIGQAVHDLAVLIGEHDCEESPWTL